MYTPKGRRKPIGWHRENKVIRHETESAQDDPAKLILSEYVRRYGSR